MVQRIAGLFALVAAALLALLVTEAPAFAAEVTPALVLAGGHMESDAIYRRIVDLAGGPGEARIAIITAASEDARGNGASYVAEFERRGARAVWIPIDESHPEAASSPEVVKQLRGVTGVMFGGGDQSRLTSLLRPNGADTPALAAIRASFEEGRLVVAGTSAGTAVMTKAPMIAGGESEDALRYRPVRLGAPAASALASAAAAPANVHPLVYDPAGGLGLFTHGSLDTHFSERGREGRLIRLAAETGQRFAFGVDEDTALVVERPLSAKPRMSVVGTNRVNVFALADAKTSARRGGVAFAARDVRVTSLAAGDRFDASTGAATFAPWRKPVAAAGRASVPSGVRHDVFSSTANASPSGARQNPRAFADASRAFLASANRQLTARSYEGGAAVVFRRTLASEAVGGVRGVTSYRDLRVDLRGARPASAPAAARSPRR